MRRCRKEENEARRPEGLEGQASSACGLETGEELRLPLPLMAELDADGKGPGSLLLLRDECFPGLAPDFACDLVHHYLHALVRCPHRPRAIVLVGQAVALLASESPVAGELFELVERGAKLLVCARSLARVGTAVSPRLLCRMESLNSMQLMETLTTSDRVITLT
ncbi:MAG: DsrE family protein [Bacillota bacterium]|nr:DsrE family protein [Bacillota bacterium]